MKNEEAFDFFDSTIEKFQSKNAVPETPETYTVILQSFFLYYSQLPEIIEGLGTDVLPPNLLEDGLAPIFQKLGERLSEKKELADWVTKQAFKFAAFLMGKFTVTNQGELQLRSENHPKEWKELDYENYMTIIAHIQGFYHSILEQSTLSEYDKKAFLRRMVDGVKWENVIAVEKISNSKIMIDYFRNKFQDTIFKEELDKKDLSWIMN